VTLGYYPSGPTPKLIKFSILTLDYGINQTIFEIEKSKGKQGSQISPTSSSSSACSRLAGPARSRPPHPGLAQLATWPSSLALSRSRPAHLHLAWLNRRCMPGRPPSRKPSLPSPCPVAQLAHISLSLLSPCAADRRDPLVIPFLQPLPLSSAFPASPPGSCCYRGDPMPLLHLSTVQARRLAAEGRITTTHGPSLTFPSWRPTGARPARARANGTPALPMFLPSSCLPLSRTSRHESRKQPH